MRIRAQIMQMTQKANHTRSVAVLLFPDFSNLCLANVVEPLRAANMLSRRELYAWRFLGAEAGVIRSSSGLPVQISSPLTRAPGGDVLCVMPSYRHEQHVTPFVLRALRGARRRFDLIAGLDTGSWLIAAAGLMNGRRATIHWDVLDAFAEAFPEIETVESRFVLADDLASCGGATTALELMLALIERDHGAMLSLEVAALFMYGERGPRIDPAQRLPEDRIVRAAAALMRRRIEQPMPIAAVAAELGLSRRALELRFRSNVGETPAGVYRAIRLKEARRLAEQTTLPVAEIAGRCGYADATAMTRAFKAVFGAPPSAFRSSARPSS